MAAAYADDQLADEEKSAVRDQLAKLAGGKLPPGVDERIKGFHPKRFDVKTAAAPFLADSVDDRRKILVLAAAIIEADQEINFAEDGYLRSLAAALHLPASALEGLTVDVEAEPEVLEQAFATVRKSPPPPPPPARKP